MSPFPFAVMHTTLFAALGEPVVVQRGDELPLSMQAIVRFGVIHVGEFGRVIGLRTVISTPRDRWQPRRGDLVSVRGNAYTVESILSDDGYVVETVLHG